MIIEIYVPFFLFAKDHVFRFSLVYYRFIVVANLADQFSWFYASIAVMDAVIKLSAHKR